MAENGNAQSEKERHLKMQCACVILNYNDWKQVVALVKSIEEYRCFSNIVVVDNCSTDDSLEKLQPLEQNRKIKVICSTQNAGYGAGNNFGAYYAFQKLGAEAVLICNPDVSFEEKLVERLQRVLQEKDCCGVVSAIQRDRNGREIDQSAWRIPKKAEYIFSIGKIGARLTKGFYISAHALHQRPVTKVDCVAGSLLLVGKDAFEKIGGYDENVFLYCEETILGCKMKNAGYSTYICSDVDYLHLHGVTIAKSVSSSIKRKKLLLKSHRYTLKHYFKANAVQMFLDSVVGQVAILEEYLKEVLT